MSLMTSTHVAEWANRNAAAGEQSSVWAGGREVTPVLATPAAAAAAQAARVLVATQAAGTLAVATGQAAAQVTGYAPEAALTGRTAPEGASFSALMDAVG
ncbi:hypothetical protein [Streptomyces ureilyticus]|uniref:PAS domain-containing protein n=1 Tax=Streptomyces ureilyticus TaxID=1775131 RepID=A0ABX0DR71_9ACTN|nr:hypothetical protein [Streptomyces ureilyticus]NGO43244.1 hypothetical protein [Streptomyces ureilyticus]